MRSQRTVNYSPTELERELLCSCQQSIAFPLAAYTGCASLANRKGWKSLLEAISAGVYGGSSVSSDMLVGPFRARHGLHDESCTGTTMAALRRLSEIPLPSPSSRNDLCINK